MNSIVEGRRGRREQRWRVRPPQGITSASEEYESLAVIVSPFYLFASPYGHCAKDAIKANSTEQKPDSAHIIRATGAFGSGTSGSGAGFLRFRVVK
jgi:hypothetical protein